jgi:hypothetical protein|tara:strand:- start:240 stop:767 length:528 start_codon:yes stop_codon:yes gene_type:complete
MKEIEKEFHSKLDKLINKWNKMNEDMDWYTSKFADEHWEGIVTNHLNGEEDMSDELYYFMVDELNGSFDKLHTKYNLMNLFDLEEDELKRTEERSIELLYNMVTKVSTSIIIMNNLEKYENSAVLNNKLEDLYILINCGIEEGETSPKILKKEFKNLMEKVFKTIENTVFFKDEK